MREQVEKAVRECSSTTHTGGKVRFVDRKRGLRHDGTGEDPEDEAARPSCSQGRGTAEAESQGLRRRRRAGICSRHRRGEATEGKDLSSEAKRREGKGGGAWGRRHECLAETCTGQRAVEDGGGSSRAADQHE